MKITYLFTTFPKLSERFLQREIEAMRELGVELEIFSLFRGRPEFQGLPVRRFRIYHWLVLPWALIREYRRHPDAFANLVRELRLHRPAGAINRLETLLGFAFAVVWAESFRRTNRRHLHAVWATAPATAALLLKELSGVRFSMGAHAYDVFRDGGDWLLPAKLASARLIHTSTEATRQELLARGADPSRVIVVRRGLRELPELRTPRSISADEPIRLLAVGRLVEKKGLDSLLRICAELRADGIPFECRIVGGGPLRRKLGALQRSLDLEDSVRFLGEQSYATVAGCYRWADLFCFTGRIAASSDRDGLPNVIPEAMSYGLPVLSASVSGTVEAIADGVSGYLLDPAKPGEWVKAIGRLRTGQSLREQFGRAGRVWVEANFDASRNAARLLEAFQQMKPGESPEK